jgi:hypothetical protein
MKTNKYVIYKLIETLKKFLNSPKQNISIKSNPNIQQIIKILNLRSINLI